MRKIDTSPLTDAELDEIKRLRAAAKARLRAMPDDDSAPTGTLDPENPPLTDEQLARMRPAHEVHPELVAARLRRRSGQPREAPKHEISVPLDADVIERLRSTGADWQTRINGMLRKVLHLGD